MSLDDNYNDLLNSIFKGEKEIAIFVLDGKHYFISDDKNNFCIDVSIEYEIYKKKGWINESGFNEALKLFRSGIPVLTKKLFLGT